VAGYSKTPLSRKLGISAGSRVKTGNAPPGYAALLGPLPGDVAISPRLRGRVDLWHLFVKSKAELRRRLPRCLSEIGQSGAVWVSWPKKSSDLSGDLTEDGIREIALPLGLVDVKVCAVDETWSGLKLVIRRSLRK
jgi:hypothetical protein